MEDEKIARLDKNNTPKERRDRFFDRLNSKLNLLLKKRVFILSFPLKLMTTDL